MSLRPRSPAPFLPLKWILPALAFLLTGTSALAEPADTTAAKPGASASAPRHPQVGIGAHLERYPQHRERALALMAEAGITWIRDDFYWKEIEKTKGHYALPESYRKMIDDCHAAGFSIVAIFNGSNTLYAPDRYDPQAYARAAAWFAKETAGKVQAIEILNEPHNFGYTKHYGGSWNGVDSKTGEVDPWVGKYVTLLNVAAKAIKAANPSVKVIGLGSVPPVNFRQLAMGIAPEVDGIVEHPYSFRLTPELLPYASSSGILKRDGIATADTRGTFASQMRMYRELSEKHNGPRELWLTEWGWPTHQEAKAGGLYAGFTEITQAKYTLRRLMESLGLGVEVTMIYDLKDDGTNPYEAEHRFGLLDYQLNPKPSYHAVKRFTSVMTGYTARKTLEVEIFSVNNRPDAHPIVWDGSKLAATGKIMCHQFEDANGQPLIALWSSERATGELNPLIAEVEIATTQPVVKVKAYDFMTGESHSLPFKTKNGRVVLDRLSIPDYPLALTLH